jgi:zinc D-Ala-D-Ala carboxypeptidase
MRPLPWPTSSAGLGPVAAHRRPPGAYGRLDPPAELVGHGNGRIPAPALEPIGVGSHRLWGPAARAFRAMRTDAAAAGVRLGVTDSYRDLDTQVSLVRRKGLYSQGGLAARPGTSNHGWGMAVDLDLDHRAQAWMRDNGWRYGFVEDTPREPWHWAFRPAGGTHSVR